MTTIHSRVLNEIERLAVVTSKIINCNMYMNGFQADPLYQLEVVLTGNT